MVKRRKTLKIWLKRTRDIGGVEGTRLEAKDTKNIRSQRLPFREQTLSRARRQAQVLQKKMIRSSKIFLRVLKKRSLTIFFSCFQKNKVKKSPKKQIFLQKTIYKILRIPKILLSLS